MRRSSWKTPYIENSLFRKVLIMKKKASTAFLKTCSRSSVISPLFIGMRFKVYNGKTFHPLSVTPDMVGHKFGEFIFTRARYEFKKKKKKKK